MKHPMAVEHLSRLDRVLGDLRILHAVGIIDDALLTLVYHPLDACHSDRLHEWAAQVFEAQRQPAPAPVEDEADEPAPNSPDDLGGYTAPAPAPTSRRPEGEPAWWDMPRAKLKGHRLKLHDDTLVSLDAHMAGLGWTQAQITKTWGDIFIALDVDGAGRLTTTQADALRRQYGVAAALHLELRNAGLDATERAQFSDVYLDKMHAPGWHDVPLQALQAIHAKARDMEPNERAKWARAAIFAARNAA